ncbi:MAG: hypothetical protein GKR90_19630 [Pseudomonadales bacterium]|nr:hypothetical protein [Pseudomonadales bacterium]
MSSRFAQLKNLQDWYQALSTRERVLVLAAVAAGVWVVWLFAIWEPLLNTSVSVQQKEQRLESEANAAGNSLAMQVQVDAEVADLESDLGLVADEIAQLELDLEQAMRAFVPPERMVGVLRDVLVKVPGVHIVSLRSQLPEAVTNGDQIVFYRHPVTLEIEGRYANLHDYLVALESRTEMLSFHSLDYQVVEHPLARATLKLSTLSRSKEWLGV